MHQSQHMDKLSENLANPANEVSFKITKPSETMKSCGWAAFETTRRHITQLLGANLKMNPFCYDENNTFSPVFHGVSCETRVYFTTTQFSQSDPPNLSGLPLLAVVLFGPWLFRKMVLHSTPLVMMGPYESSP